MDFVYHHLNLNLKYYKLLLVYLFPLRFHSSCAIIIFVLKPPKFNVLFEK